MSNFENIQKDYPTYLSKQNINQLDNVVGNNEKVNSNKALSNLPTELKKYIQWVSWILEKSVGKTIKRPYIAGLPKYPSNRASVTNQTTWKDFETAWKSFVNKQCDGIGFIFTKDDPFCFIDLDHCIDEAGNIEPKSKQIIEKLNSYTEISQSGLGIHIIVRAELPKGSGNRKGNFEIYTQGRYCAMTGNVLDGYPKTIEKRQEQVNQICDDIFGKTEPKESSKIQSSIVNLSDQEIIEKASNAKNGLKFKLLMAGDISGYQSESEADLALVNLIAFYTQDKGQILRIIEQSALYDEKWERADYQDRTIDKALSNLSERYNPSGNHGSIGKSNKAGEPVTEKEAEPIQEKLIMPFYLTDYGNAERLVYYHGENIRYCEAMKSWFIWDGKRWKTDDCLEIERLAKDTVRRIYNEAGICDNENQRKAIADHAKRSEANNKIQAMVSLARSESGIIIRPNDLDRDGFLLNCENGTIDLRTGELSPHRKSDNITKIIPVSFDPIAECPRWELFLKEIFNNDSELITFIKYAVGYSLTGSIKEECIFICYGTGRNGKSKFLDTLEYILGEYGKNVDPSTFEDIKKSAGSASEDIARLKDSRFISTIETAEGRRLSENLIKKMTGDRIISARELYQRTFQFEQAYKIWIATNHKPIIRGTDNAIWERIKLIPFEVYFSEEKRDKDLLEKLVAEAPGILNWALEGCLCWQGLGLYPVTADKVKVATKDYRNEMDLIGEFIKDKCIQKENISVSKQFLYNAYSEWCKESGIIPESKIRFGRRLKESYDIKDESGTDNVSIWKNIGLKYATTESQ